MLHRRSSFAAVLAATALVMAGCGSDSGSDASPDTTTAPNATDAPSATDAPTTTTEAKAAPLTILVANDDGYDAPGIDALVEGLRKDPANEILVVAPLAQQSGTGGKSTDGPLALTDAQTASGYDAKAVDGFPADAIRVAIDEEGIEPDLVITGINEGQNVGPAVDLSGTVGAARAAVARDIPALATSQGTGQPVDFEAAVPLILDWLAEHREALAAGTDPVEVTSLNVPSCGDGDVKGPVDVQADLTGDLGTALGAQDCTVDTPADPEAGDIAAFTAGYATFSTLADEPAV